MVWQTKIKRFGGMEMIRNNRIVDLQHVLNYFQYFVSYYQLLFQGSDSTQDRSFIRNKVAQIISLAFVHDYPHRWPSFFSDLLQTLSPNHQSVDIYLRVLLAIDSDVVDREIAHTQEVIILYSVENLKLIIVQMKNKCYATAFKS